MLPPRVLGTLAVAALLFAGLGVPGPRRAAAQDPTAGEVNRVNPLAADPAAVGRGRGLFVQTCAPCHGVEADGHGPGSVGLTPSPANLAGPDVVPRYSDGYLFWRISKGKRGSAMPSFQHSLGEAERWSIVAWLRSLPQRAPGPAADRDPIVSAH